MPALPKMLGRHRRASGGSTHSRLFILSTVIATNILLVDEIMRAGMSSLRE